MGSEMCIRDRYKVVKNYYYPGWHEPATILDGFFDLKEWNALDEDLKQIVSRGAAATNLFILSKFQAINNTAMHKLVAEKGVQLRTYSDELLNAIGERAASVVPDLASRSENAKSLYNHIIDFRKGMLNWSNYSEGAFLKARVAAPFKNI